jgi:hypothetical protein
MESVLNKVADISHHLTANVASPMLAVQAVSEFPIDEAIKLVVQLIIAGAALWQILFQKRKK